MSNMDNDKKTNGAGGSESCCNDGVGCARSGCRVRALRRRASEEGVNMERRKNTVDGAAKTACDAITITIRQR